MLRFLTCYTSWASSGGKTAIEGLKATAVNAQHIVRLEAVDKSPEWTRVCLESWGECYTPKPLKDVVLELRDSRSV